MALSRKMESLKSFFSSLDKLEDTQDLNEQCDIVCEDDRPAWRAWLSRLAIPVAVLYSNGLRVEESRLLQLDAQTLELTIIGQTSTSFTLSEMFAEEKESDPHEIAERLRQALAKVLSQREKQMRHKIKRTEDQRQLRFWLNNAIFYEVDERAPLCYHFYRAEFVSDVPSSLSPNIAHPIHHFAPPPSYQLGIPGSRCGGSRDRRV